MIKDIGDNDAGERERLGKGQETKWKRWESKSVIRDQSKSNTNHNKK